MLDNITDRLDNITDRLDNVIVRLVAYYIATSLFFASILLLLPDILISITGGEMSSILTILSSPQSGAEVGRLLEKSSVSGADLRLEPEDVERLLEKSGVFYLPTFVPISMALLFSFFYALPVTWVYRWTRPARNTTKTLSIPSSSCPLRSPSSFFSSRTVSRSPSVSRALLPRFSSARH